MAQTGSPFATILDGIRSSMQQPQINKLKFNRRALPTGSLVVATSLATKEQTCDTTWNKDGVGLRRTPVKYIAVPPT